MADMFKYKNGDRVDCRIGQERIPGTVRGAATIEQAMIGRNWIVQLDEGFGFPSETYPFIFAALVETELAPKIENRGPQ